MATRLTSTIASLLSCLTLTACGISSTQSPAHFCAVTETRLPLRLSRRDTPETLRQGVILNSIHEELCNEAKPGAKD